MQMKHRAGAGWETLYPKTLADNVKLNNGKTVEQWKQEVDDDLNELEPLKNGSPYTPLWTGNLLMDDTDIVTPTKTLSNCLNGWILAWKRPDKNEQYQFTYIPKLLLTVQGSDDGSKSILSALGGRVVHKYYYINDTRIKGHSSNANEDNERIALIGVYEY